MTAPDPRRGRRDHARRYMGMDSLAMARTHDLEVFETARDGEANAEAAIAAVHESLHGFSNIGRERKGRSEWTRLAMGLELWVGGDKSGLPH